MDQDKALEEYKLIKSSKTKFYENVLENKNIDHITYQKITENKTESFTVIEYKLIVYLNSDESIGGIMVTKKEFDDAITEIHNLLKDNLNKLNKEIKIGFKKVNTNFKKVNKKIDDGFEEINSRLDAIENCPTVKKELKK